MLDLQEINIRHELGHLNSAQTGQLTPLFLTFTDLVNRVGALLNTDWLVPNSLFSPSNTSKVRVTVLTMSGIEAAS